MSFVQLLLKQAAEVFEFIGVHVSVIVDNNVSAVAASRSSSLDLHVDLSS